MSTPLAQKKRESISDIETARTGRQDFPTAQTLTGDISSAEIEAEDISKAQASEDISKASPLTEDIIIKCNLEEMTKSFFQDYVIVWHDPNINSQENQQYITQLKKFCDVLTFTEWQKARDFVQSSPTACHIVTSGTNGEVFAKEIHQLPSVVNIYIFCGNKDYHSQWAKNYSKVSCIEMDIQSLLSQIQSNLLSWYKHASSLKLNLPAFAPIFNDSDKSQMNNLHRFLKIIPRFENRLQAKTDFLNLSKAIYSSDPHNTKFLTDFEQNYNEYDKGQTLKWYSQESFLYKVTNNCLRIATSDSIQYCRLLLQDIEKAIREHYQTKSKNFNGLLYRGAYLSAEEWSNLKLNLNREIEMHGFLSVSKVKNVGLNFMKADPSKKVFITIIVPKGPTEDEQGFAEMQEFSEYPQEKEILFNVRSRFTVLETEDDGPYRHLVLLYGAQGFRKYITEQNPILDVSIMGQLSCSHCKDASSSIFFLSLNKISPEQQIYFCNKCIDHNSAPFLCVPSVAKKETTTRKVIGCCLLINPIDFPFYGYECSKCKAKKQTQYFLCTDCNQTSCQSCFEKSSTNCTSHNVILETHPFSFWSQTMSENELQHLKFQNNLVINNKFLGFLQAQMFYQSQLYEKAIEYYRAYIKQNEVKSNDIDLAAAHLNLANIFQVQRKYKEALEHTHKCLNISKSISGEDDPLVLASYAGIAVAYKNQGEIDKALEYSLKALDTAKLIYGDNDPDIAPFHQVVGSIYSSQGNYEKALEHSMKCLEIDISVHGEIHSTSASSYSTIAIIYQNQGEPQKALEYFFKSLDTYKALYGDNHPETATTSGHIGSIYDSQGESVKALEFYFKALEITKFVYGEKHPSLIIYYNKIGNVFMNQQEGPKALECFLKSLDIGKSIYEDDNHLEISETYNNIGIVYNYQGESKKALECFLKSLDIEKSVYAENDPNIATTYNNIGLIHDDLGEFTEAVEYYFKSIEIYRASYGDSHPLLANAYQNIGCVFQEQGEDKKAFEYFSKSYCIYKSVYGDNDIRTLTSQFRMSEVQSLD